MPTEFRPRISPVIYILGTLAAVTLTAFVLLIFLAASQHYLNPVITSLTLVSFCLLLAEANALFQLLSMSYTLSQTGLKLKSGFREIFIPMRKMQWVRSISDFKTNLPLPRLHFSGLTLGQREVSGLGLVEFMLTDPKTAVIFNAGHRTFAISPRETQSFLDMSERYQLMGTLEALPCSESSFIMLWQFLWSQKKVRSSLLIGLGLALICLIIAVIISLTRDTISWVSLETVPSSQVLLIPVLAFFIYLIDLIFGFLIFQSKSDVSFLSNWIWWTSSFVTLIFIVAILFML